MLEEPIPVGPPTLVPRLGRQGRHPHFIDQMSEKCRLRQDFGVEERRPRLQHDGRELFEAMQPARRVDVVQRQSKDQSRDQPLSQGCPAAASGPGPAADHMIALSMAFSSGAR